MTQATPQLILSLSPDDKLVVELPGPHATRRRIELAEADPIAQLKRMLRAQREGATGIGLDGGPTERQVRHWERHEIWSDSKCPFCWAEGRFAEPVAATRQRRSETIYKLESGVEVRRVRSGASGVSGNSKARKNPEELGL